MSSNSFIDFLSLYGHFGGEELEEIDEEDEEDLEDDLEEDEPSPTSRNIEGPTERTSLLKRSASSKPRLSRKKSQNVGRHGDATVTQAVLMVCAGL